MKIRLPNQLEIDMPSILSVDNDEFILDNRGMELVQTCPQLEIGDLITVIHPTRGEYFKTAKYTASKGWSLV